MPNVPRSHRRVVSVFGLAVLLAACAEVREPSPPGGACVQVWHCEEGLVCASGRCRAPSPVGGPCDPRASVRECESGLACAPDLTCQTPEVIEERRAVERHAREQEMLRASGVATEIVAEVPVQAPEAVQAPAGPGLPVRVVRVEGRGSALAACRSEERLIGGGCAGRAMVMSSYPSHHAPTDTVGARWNCASSADTTVEAYALCQALPDAP